MCDIIFTAGPLLHLLWCLFKEPVISQARKDMTISKGGRWGSWKSENFLNTYWLGTRFIRATALAAHPALPFPPIGTHLQPLIFWISKGDLQPPMCDHYKTIVFGPGTAANGGATIFFTRFPCLNWATGSAHMCSSWNFVLLLLCLFSPLSSIWTLYIRFTHLDSRLLLYNDRWNSLCLLHICL